MIYEEESIIWQTWKHRLLVLFVFVLALCLTLLPVWQRISIQPILFLIPLYYWTLYRPNILSVEKLVLISLIQDGIYAYPLGFSALRILINYALLMSQKRILSHQRFLWIWGGFGLFVFLDGVIYTVLLSSVKREWVGILPLVPGLLMTTSIYPIGVWLMNRYVMKRLPI